MSKRVNMTALQDVRVEGEVVEKGKPFTCELRDSKILVGNGQAEIRVKKRAPAAKKTVDNGGKGGSGAGDGSKSGSGAGEGGTGE
ncbi:MAG: hypothetical protein AB2793_12795 [Candidatus Thiodiazotropha sp.]